MSLGSLGVRPVAGESELKNQALLNEQPPTAVEGLFKTNPYSSKRGLDGKRAKGGKMKAKTHSGAKKRMRVLPSGKVKRKKAGRRHRLISENHKTKRQLAKGAYVHSANMLQTSRLLLIKV